MRPFLAQGAGDAIEDAAVLADSLRNASDIPAALRAYEAARKPRVQKVAEASARTGEQYHYAGLMALARNAALRVAVLALSLNGMTGSTGGERRRLAADATTAA